MNFMMEDDLGIESKDDLKVVDYLGDDWKEGGSNKDPPRHVGQDDMTSHGGSPPSLPSKPKDGQDRVAPGAVLVPESENLSTTTPVRVGKVGDRRGSTTLFELWDRMSQKKKEKAFELWTSPVSMGLSLSMTVWSWMRNLA